MRQDEADTVVLFAMTPWRHLLTDATIPNNHLLHSAMVKVAIALFGSDPWVVRLPAYLAGVGVIPVTFLLGRALGSPFAGVVAAGIAVASTPLVLFSTNARGYSLITLATLLLLWILALQRSTPATWRWVLFSVIAAAGFLVNPSMLYPLGGIALWGLLTLRRRAAGRWHGLGGFLGAGVAAAVLTLIGYAPMIAVSGWRSLAGNQYVRSLRWSVFFNRLPDFFAGLVESWTVGWPVVAVIAAVGCLVTSVVPGRSPLREVPRLALIMVSWALLVLVMTRRPPFPRVWLYLLPIVALTAADGLVRLAGHHAPRVARRILPALALLVALAGGAGVVGARTPDRITETGVFPDAERVADRLASLLQPGDVVAAMFREQGPVHYYLQRDGIPVRFLNERDSVASRLFVVQSATRDETVASVVARRRLRGVQPERARMIDSFPTAVLWLVPAADHAPSPLPPASAPPP